MVNVKMLAPGERSPSDLKYFILVQSRLNEGGKTEAFKNGMKFYYDRFNLATRRNSIEAAKIHADENGVAEIYIQNDV